MNIEFAIRGDYIQLDQLLKATGMASSGGMAHTLISEGKVHVDGKVETRKRAKLRPGGTVAYLDQVIVLHAAPSGDSRAT